MIISEITVILAIATFVVVVVVSHLASLYVDYKIDLKLRKIIRSGISDAELSKLHGEMAYTDGCHDKVIAARNKLAYKGVARIGDAPSPLGFYSALGFLSDYYGQGNRMLRQGNLLAFVFYTRALSWQSVAKHNLTLEMEASLSLTEIEVLYAPDFLLEKVPLIGYFYRENLIRVFKQTLNHSEDSGQHLTLGHALLASKLWALTGDLHYRYVVSRIPISKASDQNTVARIVKHLGMKDHEELYTLCKGAK